MLHAAAFPAVPAARLRRRLGGWTTAGSLRELDDRLRRDVGLPRVAPAAPIRPDRR
ncbi:hypothetical protein GCM10010964_02540 [Caldovatus sediminis]|uniref:Uncharacterized protein n=2 Tax=Caldovatus sediminis TaxID=2041189 RepID=A0A8J2Z7F4_9PROT|nr:hypothetical protein GCM10010964_02540 [Caldovatus sediminis]